MLGPRVNALSVAAAAAPARPARRDEPDARRAIALGAASRTAVMRRPIAVLVPDARRSCSSSGRRSCGSSRACPTRPSTRPASRAATRGSRSRPSSAAGETTPIVVLARHPGRRRIRETIAGARARRRAARRRVDGIDRVEGPFAHHRTRRPAQPLTRRAGRRSCTRCRRRRSWPPRPRARSVRTRYIRGGTVRLDAISPLKSSEPAGTAVDLARPRGRARTRRSTRMQVGGGAALGEDFLRRQADADPVGRGHDAARARR